MRFQLPIVRGMARPSSIPLFAERPSHPSAPLGDASAVARRRRQGRPLAGARALPLTAASTMARLRRSGSRACARVALLIVVGVISVIAPVPPAHAQMAATRVQAASDPFSAFVTEAAQRFGIPAAWIRAVMRAESHGDRRAISPKGAMGVMQLMPDTWAALRVRYGLGRDPYDPHDNILAGAAYLREMHDRYGSPDFLAAYNAGTWPLRGLPRSAPSVARRDHRLCRRIAAADRRRRRRPRRSHRFRRSARRGQGVALRHAFG